MNDYWHRKAEKEIREAHPDLDIVAAMYEGQLGVSVMFDADKPTVSWRKAFRIGPDEDWRPKMAETVAAYEARNAVV